MRLKSLITTTAIALASLSVAAQAQTPRTATYSGSTWGFYQYETGGDAGTILTGQPSLFEGHPDAVITVVTRDGVAITEADRNLAIGLARGLCEQSGRHFNSQTRGHWLNNGGLGFQGACTR